MGKRVAVWRLGLPVQAEGQSTVGGGRLTSAVLAALQEAGAEVTVTGPASRGTDAWLRSRGIRHEPARRDLSGFDVAVVLTGPFNAMYPDTRETFRRLSRFEGRAVYAQWDVALPFHFGALRNERFRHECGVWEGSLFQGKEWILLSQVREPRTSAAKSVAYDTAVFEHVRCLFELVELEQPVLPVAREVVPAVAYFGSDRPGRLRELQRWFGYEGAPPLHLYGRWSDANLAELMRGQGLHSTVEFRGPVHEARVAELLNGYAATLYLADPAYVRTDFVAQRFFENVRASVPVLYSDKIQPSVAAAVAAEWGLGAPEDLRARFANVLAMNFAARSLDVARHRAVVERFARGVDYTLERAIRRVLS